MCISNGTERVRGSHGSSVLPVVVVVVVVVVGVCWCMCVCV